MNIILALISRLRWPHQITAHIAGSFGIARLEVRCAIVDQPDRPPPPPNRGPGDGGRTRYMTRPRVQPKKGAARRRGTIRAA